MCLGLGYASHQPESSPAARRLRLTVMTRPAAGMSTRNAELVTAGETARLKFAVNAQADALRERHDPTILCNRHEIMPEISTGHSEPFDPTSSGLFLPVKIVWIIFVK